MRNLLILLALSASIVASGCDGQQIVVAGKKNNTTLNNDNNPIVNNTVNNPVNNHSHDDHEGHGGDDEAEQIETGFLSGTWRVARAEDDAPLVDFDFVHDKDASIATGNFMMGNALYEELDRVSGDLVSTTWDTNGLDVRWNPTNDDEEVYVITETVRVDDNALTGTFHGTRNPVSFAVTIDRRLFDEVEETDVQ